jgi:poly-gamma-glutamate synthesis protein (capsule biosynthesis protein)
MAKEQGAARVVVSVHWGAEQIVLPKPGDVDMAHAIIDAGADLLIGHHTHCVQPWEIYKEKFIFYGLGNCIFPDIDVPSFYHFDIPTKIYSVKNRFWNRRSLAVEYFPVDGSVKIRQLVFDGETLMCLAEINNIEELSFKAGAHYKDRFHRAFVMGKIKWAFFRYMANPKLPSLNHLRSMVNMASTKLYK